MIMTTGFYSTSSDYLQTTQSKQVLGNKKKEMKVLGLTLDVSLSFVGQVRTLNISSFFTSQSGTKYVNMISNFAFLTRFVDSPKVVWSCSSNSESEERLRGGASRYSKRDGRPT